MRFRGADRILSSIPRLTFEAVQYSRLGRELQWLTFEAVQYSRSGRERSMPLVIQKIRVGRYDWSISRTYASIEPAWFSYVAYSNNY